MFELERVEASVLDGCKRANETRVARVERLCWEPMEKTGLTKKGEVYARDAWTCFASWGRKKETKSEACSLKNCYDTWSRLCAKCLLKVLFEMAQPESSTAINRLALFHVIKTLTSKRPVVINVTKRFLHDNIIRVRSRLPSHAETAKQPSCQSIDR